MVSNGGEREGVRKRGERVRHGESKRERDEMNFYKSLFGG